eukprot:scaffold246545_cov16-Tisochrysis_lutea.AAC.2
MQPQPGCSPSVLPVLYLPTGGLTRITTRATWGVSGRSPLPALPTPRASCWRRCKCGDSSNNSQIVFRAMMLALTRAPISVLAACPPLSQWH